MVFLKCQDSWGYEFIKVELSIAFLSSGLIFVPCLILIGNKYFK